MSDSSSPQGGSRPDVSDPSPERPEPPSEPEAERSSPEPEPDTPRPEAEPSDPEQPVTAQVEPVTEPEPDTGDVEAAPEPAEPAALDEEVEPADDSVGVEDTEAAPGRLRRMLENDRLGWIVAAVASAAAVLAIIAALIVTSWWAPLHSEARDREEVRRVGESFTVHLATFSGETIDEWVDETRERATGNYAEQVEVLFDEDLREALRDLEVESEGELVNLFVQELDGPEATLFALVRQTVTNAVAEEPFEDELRMEIHLTREADEWLVSDVAVLGPAQPTVPAPTVPEEAPDPDIDPAPDPDPEAEDGGEEEE